MAEKTYEEAMARLDEIIDLLENNEASLDESLDLYKEGVSLAAVCDTKLKDVDQEVTKIFEETIKINLISISSRFSKRSNELFCDGWR